MFEYHQDKERYFDMQYLTAKEHLLPFVEKHLAIGPGSTVLEVGCAEAGVLKAFLERGAHCFGVDLNSSRIALAKTFHQVAFEEKRIQFSTENLYTMKVSPDFCFDLIVLKDVIEHIPDQAKFIKKLTEFLKPGGKIFFAFPPWQMPFGGHQQMCRSGRIAKLPWIHLLPERVYRALLKSCGEAPEVIQELMEIKSTGISIRTFENIVAKVPLEINDQRFFLTNPIYYYKFGLKPRRVWGIFNAFPYVRNFYTTAAYYLVSR